MEPRIKNPRDTTPDARAPRVEQTPMVSFDTRTKSPNETVPRSPQTYATEPRVQKDQSKDIIKAIIDKPMLPKGNKLTSIPLASNFIDAELMKSKTEDAMINAYITLWKCLTTSNTVKPKIHMLDNEASDKFKNEIKKNCRIQLVPLDTHQRNLEERAIQTFKNHFKAIIQDLDETFPMKLWDKLLPQTILTLNLLRQSNAVPTVLAHQYVHGQFDYNAMPLAPLGCTVQMHEAPTKRGTWAENTTDGWYIQTSPEHYRCH